MSDEPEKLLSALTPRSAPACLRERVLAAVGGELARRQSSWGSRCAWAMAAGLLLGVGLNVWVLRTQETRMAQLYGPEPMPRRIAGLVQAVESVSDEETARWFAHQLVAARRRSVEPSTFWRESERIRLCSDLMEGFLKNDPPQDDSENRWDRTRGDRGDLPHRQRRPGQDYGRPA